MAFEEALVMAPERVLAALDSSSASLQLACGPSSYPTYDLASNSLYERQSAVMSMLLPDAPKHSLVRRESIEECLKLLEAEESDIQQRYSP